MGKDCYYLVLDGARRDILRSRAKPTDRIMTLREFCERGLALYSDKPVISRNKELALLESTISKRGRVFGRGAMVEIYRLMDELSKNFKEIKPENKRLEDLGSIISSHYSYLESAGMISRTMIEREALALIEDDTWFPMRDVYLELYPIVSEVESRIAETLDSKTDLTLVSSDSRVTDHYLAFSDSNEELEFVAREIIKANIGGIPLESMAVVTPKADYLPMIEEILDEYSIPHTNYAYTLVKDTKVFEFLSQLAVLVKNDFRAMDLLNLFSNPLVRYKSLSRISVKRAQRFMSAGGVESIKKDLRRTADAGDVEKEIADDLVEALQMIHRSQRDGLSSLLPLMMELGVVRSIAEGPSEAEAEDSLRRESTAYRRIIDAMRDLAWAEKIVGEEPTLEALVDLLYGEGYSAVYSGGVSVLLDKSGFWGGFERIFYCGLSMSAMYPEESAIISDREAEMLGVLERKKSAEMRARTVLANMRDTVTCVLNDSEFTVFDALGLNVERVEERREEIFSRVDFERALANMPDLIDYAEKMGEDYIRTIRSAERCVRSRERCETNEYNGILNREIQISAVSPGALEDYVRCPFYYFAKHLLGLRDSELENRRDIVWGNAVHRAMKALYSDCEGGIDEDMVALKGTQGFVERGMEKIKSVMLEYTDDPYVGIKVKRALSSAFPEVLRLEQSTEGIPLHLEQSLSREICGVTLRGNVDRVDIAHGKVLIYDYKTGLNGSISPESMELMQIPLYLYMEDQPFGGGFYYLISDDKSVERRDFFRGYDIHDVVEDVVRERVPAILESIKGGFFPAKYMKRSKNCADCEMRRACYVTRRMVLPFPFNSYLKGRNKK